MIAVCRAGSSMRCAVVVAGPTAPISTGRRRRSATASSAGPSARYEGIFSAPADTEDTPDRLFIDKPLHQGSSLRRRWKRGALAPMPPWYRPHQRGGRNTGLHAVRDHKGRPCVLLPTPGNMHDCRVAQRCIEAMPPSAEPVAGKGRDGRELREQLEERGTGPVIPPRKNRKIRYHYDQAIYRERDIIERMFCRLKDRRRIATRFECNIKTSWQLSRSPQPSSRGYNESRR